MGAPLSRQGSLIRQLQAALGGLEVRAGHVTDSGVLDLGDGVSAAKNTTGDYTLTFDPPFSTPARVFAMQGQGVGTALCVMKEHHTESPTPSTFRLVAISGSSATDTDFWFFAAG